MSLYVDIRKKLGDFTLEGFGDADRLEHFQTTLMRLFFSQLFVRQKHFGHLRLDPVNGV